MDDKIVHTDDEYPTLKDASIDLLASVLKAGVGSVGTVGGFLVALIGLVIPDQRLEYDTEYMAQYGILRKRTAELSQLGSLLYEYLRSSVPPPTKSV